MLSKDILITIPLFNEESTVGDVLKGIRHYYGGDILIVDDGSTDRSLEIVRESGIERVTTLRHKENMGYGQSLIDGFRYAIDEKYDAVITMDCDGQHLPEWIELFANDVRRFDLVSGSRYLRKSDTNQSAPIDRMRINRTITAMINDITRFDITDAFCGFKGYKTTALSKLRLSEPGYAMPLQFWIQADACDLSFHEIPVDRVYNNPDRSFGEDLDDPHVRLNHYLDVMQEELRRTGRGEDMEELMRQNAPWFKEFRRVQG